MDESGQSICGKGLAENSILPARLGKLIGSMAENLEVHTTALDLEDPDSRVEHAAYKRLIEQLQQVASQLAATADQMAGYRDLPMGRHNEKEMKHPRVLETFETFVNQKRALLSLLERTTEQDDKLLEMMRIHSQ